MSKQIQKSFRNGLSKIKTSNKKIKLLSLPSCRRTKTPSFRTDGKEKENEDDNAITLSDIDQFMFENFRSLYHNKENEKDEEISISIHNNAFKTSSYPYESRRLFDPPPAENLCGSPRFFVPSSPTSSLVKEEASSSSPTYYSSETEEISVAAAAGVAPDDFIALLTYSPSPYDDFRKSMEGMVEARLEHDGEVDWDFMEELLSCYLDLNNKKSSRFILRAFVDLVESLRENSGKIPASRRQLKGRKCNLI